MNLTLEEWLSVTLSFGSADTVYQLTIDNNAALHLYAVFQDIVVWEAYNEE
jgi:hypothetical protein